MSASLFSASVILSLSKDQFRLPFSKRAGHGFTLLEMVITLAVFTLLAAAVFGIMGGVMQGTSTLQDNQNHRDEIAALNAYLQKKLIELPAMSSLASYQRGDGDGLVQNGILFGTKNLATAIDATPQANGYYALRLTTLASSGQDGQPQDARQTLLTSVETNDPTLIWTPLIADVKTLDWKFLDFNANLWVELWGATYKPNLVEFSMQPAGDLQPTTMDFWLPRVIRVNATGAPSP